MKSEILLPVTELKTALSGLNKLIGKRTTLPVLSCIKVSRKKNGLVTLQGTDLDAFATFTLSGNQAGETVDVLVPLEQLNKAFKCSTGTKQDVALVCEGKTIKLRYFIGGNPVHQPVNSVLVAEWPPVPEITADSTPLPPGFGEALKQAMVCCSEDQARQTLRGACLDARDPKAHYVVGTNGRFLYSANSFTFPLKDAIIIPDSKFLTGSGLLDSEPCFLAVQPGKKPSQVKHICLQNKQWQFVTREIEGNYPNWKQCVPGTSGSWTTVQLSALAIEQLLTVIPNLPGKDDNHNAVRLRTGEQCLWVEGRNPDDKDWTKIAITEVKITGKAKEIALNRDYLLPALKFGLNELQIQDELTPMVCSKEGKRMVIMPVSLKGPQPQAPANPAPTPATATPQPEPNQERKTEMTTTAMTLPERGNLKPANTDPNASKDALEKVEAIKLQLRDLLGELTDLTGLLKAAEKEKRSQDKEVASVRQTIRSLQGVRI